MAETSTQKTKFNQLPEIKFSVLIPCPKGNNMLPITSAMTLWCAHRLDWRQDLRLISHELVCLRHLEVHIIPILECFYFPSLPWSPGVVTRRQCTSSLEGVVSSSPQGNAHYAHTRTHEWPFKRVKGSKIEGKTHICLLNSAKREQRKLQTWKKISIYVCMRVTSAAWKTQLYLSNVAGQRHSFCRQEIISVTINTP